MKKKLLALMLAGIMAATSAAAVTSYGAVKDTMNSRVWETSTRVGISSERQIRQEEGMTIDEWDEETARMKAEGLTDPFTEEGILEEDPDAAIFREDGRVYQIAGTRAFSPVRNAMEAYRMVYRLVPMLGGSENTDLRLWSRLFINNTTVYSFQQISGTEELLGNVVKIAGREDGTVTAVFSSLDGESSKEEIRVSRQEAEQAVLDHLREAGEKDAAVCPDYTDRVVHSPVDIARALNLDIEEEPVPDEVLWVVFTENESSEAAEYPWIAHYVTLEGDYEYSLPVPDTFGEDARNGYRKQVIFTDDMVSGSWSGVITSSNGKTKDITVPVIKSEKDGKWYLGDLDRRIAVADFAEAAYGKDHAIEMISSDTNDGWDNEDLFMYFNYIRAWDFYADMGWMGPDGALTDVVILKGLCTSSGKVYEHACSVGKVENNQMFGYTAYTNQGDPLTLVQALDVMAHEYTHTFTSTVMNENLYENDYGAINEAMSDIMGNLVEYILEDTEDTKWLLGENTSKPVRSMSDPHRYTQPEYVWDLYYGPHTDDPATVNDRGGVHFNSSLLNRIAALLCMKHEMRYEEAVDFWLTTAMGLTPRTDYVQIGELLGWALTESGNEQYLDSLRELIEEEDLGSKELPAELPEGRKIVKLQIPDNETFADENWGLLVYQLDTDTMEHLKKAGSRLLPVLQEMEEKNIDSEKVKPILMEMVDYLGMDPAELPIDNLEDPDTLTETLMDILKESARHLVYQRLTWEDRSTGEMAMVSKDIPAAYLLINLKESGTKLDGLALLIGKHWYDIGEMVINMAPNGADKDKIAENLPNTRRKMIELGMKVMLNTVTDGFSSLIDGAGAFLDSLDGKPADITEKANGPEDVSDQVEYLPSDGLESVSLLGSE